MSIDEQPNCPKCGANWIGKPIPKEHQELYGGHAYFKRGPIGIEYGYGAGEQYDGISEWECPDCHARWGRWTGQELQPEEIESRFGERGVIKRADARHFNDFLSG